MLTDIPRRIEIIRSTHVITRDEAILTASAVGDIQPVTLRTAEFEIGRTAADEIMADVQTREDFLVGPRFNLFVDHGAAGLV